ncbi:MAG: hypothetical protein Q9178_000709 [Gyalolechia marmorata]
MAALRLTCSLVIAALAVLGNAVAITGIQAGVNAYSGERPFRQEFSTFKNSGPAFDLYILALQRFQEADQRALLSYFQVAASQRVQYRAAARTLRIPYWDWSINPTMPPEVNQPTIYIKTPNGTAGVPNPLIRSMTYTLLTQQPNYGIFSNTRYNDGRDVGRYNSIENMHNGIHMLVGNGGHMSNIPYSSYDPIFWLHHANTDRLFALWQAVYPESNFTSSQTSAFGTLTNDAGETEDINTRRFPILAPNEASMELLMFLALTPFHSDESGTIWTSATAWSTKEFGYSYPEINDWAVNSSQLSSNVKTRLNALYNPTRTTSRRSVSADASSGVELSPNAMDIQWLANIRVSKSDSPSPFFVHLYLGAAPADPRAWSFAPNLVASHSVIDTSMLNTADVDIPTTLYGQIPLNHALLAAGHSDLSPSNVQPLLKSHLNWRLQSTNDDPLDISKVPSLKIHVVGQEVKPRIFEDEFPEYGDVQIYTEVTDGKAGGLQDGDNVE